MHKWHKVETSIFKDVMNLMPRMHFFQNLRGEWGKNSGGWNKCLKGKRSDTFLQHVLRERPAKNVDDRAEASNTKAMGPLPNDAAKKRYGNSSTNKSKADAQRYQLD